MIRSDANITSRTFPMRAHGRSGCARLRDHPPLLQFIWAPLVQGVSADRVHGAEAGTRDASYAVL